MTGWPPTDAHGRVDGVAAADLDAGADAERAAATAAAVLAADDGAAVRGEAGERHRIARA